MPSLIDTWYSRTLPPRSVNTAAGTLSADTCVIGAGLAGLSCALELANTGQRVIVLESAQVGWGASGRNGGFVCPGFAQGHSGIAARVGWAEACTLHALSIEGMRQVARNIDSLQIKAATPVPGIISVCRYPATNALKARRDWLAERFDYSVDYLDRDALSERLKSSNYHDALRDPQAFHFNPLAYAQGLARAITDRGGQLYEHSAVHSITGQRRAWQVITANASVKVRDVVVATGGYTGTLSPRLNRSFLPIATYILLSRPNTELIARAIQTDSAVLDDRRASDYYRVVDNGRRLLWGGGITTRTREPRALAERLHRAMIATYPQLSSLEVDIAWSGLMSYARHRMPQIGQLPSGLWYCTAFGGHGMNTTAIGGQVVAEAISGQSDRYRHFAPFGLTYTGGIVGRAAVQTTYWTYQLMDRWREWQGGRQTP